MLETISTKSGRGGQYTTAFRGSWSLIKCPILSTDRFNKAYQHISERIDAVYKDLTKGPNAPLGGVAYLSLEDSEASYSPEQ